MCKRATFLKEMPENVCLHGPNLIPMNQECVTGHTNLVRNFIAEDLTTLCCVFVMIFR